MEKKAHLLILVFIFFLAFVLRFNQLGQVPLGLYQDETAIGYNALSISQTLKDEHGNFLPLYFKSFGDYKLSAYIYSAIIPIKLFGLNEFAVRFPSALFGFLTVIVFYFFVQELTKSRNLSIIATGFLAINPWHIHYSRATFEVSISLFLFILGGLLLLKSFNENKRGAFLIGTLCFIINLYTYNLTRFLSPILYFLILILNREKFKTAKKGELILTIIISALLLIPFLTTFFGAGGLTSTKGTSIFSSAAVQAPIIGFRSYLIDLPTIFTKTFFNTLVLTVWQYLGNITSYFSVPFFFVSGSSHGNHGIGNIGQFYLFEFPLILFGLIKIIQERIKWAKLLLLWALLVILIASLTREAPHATRSFFLLAPLEIFSGLGLLAVWSWILAIKNIRYQKFMLLVIGVFVFYNIVYYFVSYYVRFPIYYAKAWRSADKPLSLYLKENQNKYDKIIFDKEAGFIYTSLLFYLQYPTAEFQKSVIRAPDDSEGFSEVLSFGKYELRNIDWSKDYNSKKTLLIIPESKKPTDTPSLKIFSYPKRPIVISLKQEILQYPIEEVAYVLVESKEQK